MIMCYCTSTFFALSPDRNLLIFIFFATLSSYGFHWWLTPMAEGSNSIRLAWTSRNKITLLAFTSIGIIVMASTINQLREYSLPIYFLAGVTFIYSAPKIPLKPFIYLRKLAIGKTLYLSSVWTIATCILPIYNTPFAFSNLHWHFILLRFLQILPICMLFDFRDRREDRKNHILNMVTYMNAKILNTVFYVITCLFFMFWYLFWNASVSSVILCKMLVVQIVIISLFKYSQGKRNDYWFYLVLDCLML